MSGRAGICSRPCGEGKIGDFIEVLREDYTVILVTHNMRQAARVSDPTAFFYKGYIGKFSATKQIFTNQPRKQTEDYITGRFGRESACRYSFRVRSRN